MTKKDLCALYSVLIRLETAERFIKDESTAICRKKPKATTTLDYQNQAGDMALTSIEKEIGSDLCFLYSGIQELRLFIKEQEEK